MALLAPQLFDVAPLEPSRLQSLLLSQTGTSQLSVDAAGECRDAWRTVVSPNLTFYTLDRSPPRCTDAKVRQRRPAFVQQLGSRVNVLPTSGGGNLHLGVSWKAGITLWTQMIMKVYGSSSEDRFAHHWLSELSEPLVSPRGVVEKHATASIMPIEAEDALVLVSRNPYARLLSGVLDKAASQPTWLANVFAGSRRLTKDRLREVGLLSSHGSLVPPPTPDDVTPPMFRAVVEALWEAFQSAQRKWGHTDALEAWLGDGTPRSSWSSVLRASSKPLENPHFWPQSVMLAGLSSCDATAGFAVLREEEQADWLLCLAHAQGLRWADLATGFRGRTWANCNEPSAATCAACKSRASAEALRGCRKKGPPGPWPRRACGFRKAPRVRPYALAGVTILRSGAITVGAGLLLAARRPQLYVGGAELGATGPRGRRGPPLAVAAVGLGPRGSRQQPRPAAARGDRRA